MRIKSAITSSFAAHGVQLLVNLASVRFFLDAFGKDLYGYWGALLGLTSYLGLLNLGIAQTVSSRISTAKPDDDPHAIPRTIQTGLRSYARICALALPPIALVTFLLPWASMFHLDAHLIPEARIAALAVAVTFLLELPFSVFRAGLYGLGEIGKERSIASIVLLARLAAAWTFARLHPPLWIAVTALSAFNIAGHFACMLTLRRRVPGLLHKSVAPPASAEDASKFRNAGFYFLLLQIAGAVVWSTDPVFAGTLLNSAEAARVSVAWRALSIVLTFGNLVGPALGPALAQAWARGDKERARRLGLESAQLLGGVVLAGVLGILATGRVLFELWVGQGIFLGGWAWVLYCVIIAIQGLLIIPHAFMVQAGKHEQYARWTLLEATLKVVLSIAFVKIIGIAGLPLGTLLARLTTTFWFLPAAYVRELDQSLSQWLFGVLRPLVLPTLAFTACFAALRLSLPYAHPAIAVGIGVVSGLVFVVVFVLRGISPELRHRLLSMLPLGARKLETTGDS